MGDSATVYGGAGNDILACSDTSGVTTLNGGDDGDLLIIYNGVAFLTGGAGVDEFRIFNGVDYEERILSVGAAAVTDWDSDVLVFDHHIGIDWDYYYDRHDQDRSEEAWEYLGDNCATVDQVLGYAEVVGNDTVFTFDFYEYDVTLTIAGITDPTVLSDYIQFNSYYYFRSPGPLAASSSLSSSGRSRN